MELNFIARHAEITDRFRNYVAEKVDKIEKLADRPLELDVTVSKHHGGKGLVGGDHVELTLVGAGPVIRAESEGNDKYSAFDIAYGRLLERIRRSHDKKFARRGRRRVSAGEAAARDFDVVDVTPADLELIEAVETGSVPVVTGEETEQDYSPIVIRSKEFTAEHMSVEEAVDRMELVGHDFFLFIERDTGRPSVVYRRKGWDYGVIGLVDG